jgi:hypothetical protein
MRGRSAAAPPRASESVEEDRSGRPNVKLVRTAACKRRTLSSTAAPSWATAGGRLAWLAAYAPSGHCRPVPAQAWRQREGHVSELPLGRRPPVEGCGGGTRDGPTPRRRSPPAAGHLRPERSSSPIARREQRDVSGGVFGNKLAASTHKDHRRGAREAESGGRRRMGRGRLRSDRRGLRGELAAGSGS